MVNLFYSQYSLVKETRQVVFRFLQEQVMDDINKPLSTFNDKTIAYMFVHIANTYIAWAGNFAQEESAPYYDQDEPVSLTQLRNIFELVDEMMLRFSGRFAENPTGSVKGYKWPEKYIETDVCGIFTHVITHEFHHKGQAMTMARLLGYVPPDTDVMRF